MLLQLLMLISSRLRPLDAREMHVISSLLVSHSYRRFPITSYTKRVCTTDRYTVAHSTYLGAGWFALWQVMNFVVGAAEIGAV
ncbi:hypothetical protein F5Y09DRAFT_312513, partial [Xylaria sp. FL1042]